MSVILNPPSVLSSPTLKNDLTLTKFLQNVYDRFTTAVCASVYPVAAINQSLPSSTPVTVAFEQIEYDTTTMWDSSTNSYVIQIPGVYEITAAVRLVGTIPSGAVFTLQLNSVVSINNIATTVPYTIQSGPATTPSLMITRQINFNNGDTVNVICEQNSGSTLALASSLQYSWFQAKRIN